MSVLAGGWIAGQGFANAESRGTVIGFGDGLLDDAQAVSIKATISRQRFFSLSMFEFLFEFGGFLGDLGFPGLVLGCCVGDGFFALHQKEWHQKKKRHSRPKHAMPMGNPIPTKEGRL